MSTPTPTELSRGVPTRLGRLHVRAAGSGPATVLWPSMFVDGRTFDPLLPLLPGRRLVVVDGPGLGASEPLRRGSHNLGPDSRSADRVAIHRSCLP